MLSKCFIFFLNLVVILFETLDEFVKIRHGYFKFLSIVTLIISEIIHFKRSLEGTGYLPDATFTDKVLDLSATTVAMNVRQVRRTHIINDTCTKVSR